MMTPSVRPRNTLRLVGDRRAPRRRAGDVLTWAVPVLLALAVGCALLTTSTYRLVWTQWRWLTGPTVDVWWGTTTKPMTGHYALLSALAGVSVVVGVATTRWRPPVATALVLWPFASILVTDTMVFAWWLAAFAAALIFAYDGSVAVWPTSVSLAVVGGWLWLAGASVQLPFRLGVTTPYPGERSIVLVPIVLALLTVGGTGAAGALLRWQVRARERASQAEAGAQEAFEAEAATSDRARAARDLHDVVAHHVSLVAVRAESAPYVHPELDATAREVLGDIANDARDALDELRQVLTILQRAGHDEADAPRLPQPGSADVARLVADARDAGQVVDLVEPVPDLPPAQGYVVYRAVQEALTNARRHAPSEPVRVEVSVRSGVVGLRVTNAATATATPEPGRGLLGMRERAEALGGAADHAVDDGTFVLSVSLPLGGGEGEEW